MSIQPTSRLSCSCEKISGSMGISQSTNATLILGGLPKPKLCNNTQGEIRQTRPGNV